MRSKSLIAFLIIGIILSSGCATTLAELNAKLKSKSNELSGTATAQQQTTQQPTAQGATVKLGAWNVQNFGYTKAGKPETMAVIRSTISAYDMMALQEIQDVSGTTSMVAISEALPSGYRLIATQPIGRTTHQERYVIVYDPSDFNYIESYTYNDTRDGPADGLMFKLSLGSNQVGGALVGIGKNAVTFGTKAGQGVLETMATKQP